MVTTIDEPGGGGLLPPCGAVRRRRQHGGAGIVSPGAAAAFPLVRRNFLATRPNESPSGGFADGDGGGQRPGAGGGAGDGAGGLEGRCRRAPRTRRAGGGGKGGTRDGPNLLVTGHPDGTVRLPIDRGRSGCAAVCSSSRERDAGSRLRRPDGRRDQDAGTGGVQALADAGSGAQPPGIGGPGRLLLARRVRRPAGRGDRHDGHGGSHLGLGADSRRDGWSGPCRTPASGSVSLPLTTSGAGQGPRKRAAGAGLPRNQLAVPKLPLPGGLPAGSGGNERRAGDRG